LDPHSDYLKTLRSDFTRETYASSIRLVVGDGNKFLRLAKRNRRKAEDELIEYVVSHRDKTKGSTISTRLAELKSFLDFYEVQLNWKRVKSAAPPPRMVANDRPPTVEEIRTLLKYAEVRDRAIVLCMASSGVRVGALPGLDVADLDVRPSGIGVLTVYRGEPEQYQALVSPEAVQALNDYLGARRRIGEKVDGASPLFRNRWDYQKLEGERVVTRNSVAPDVAKRLNVDGVKRIVDRLWIRSGLKVRHGRSEWKTCHGFRKFFKTQGGRSGMNPDDVEALLGHASSYYKPTLEALEGEYARKALPYLAIDEKFSLRTELEVKERTHESEWGRARLEGFELRERLAARETEVADMRRTMERVLKEMTAMKREMGLQ
jgi:integrase